MSWYVTEPLDIERTRADMSLGLRNSVWFFNNAPCPGVGGVFHPRLFTLALLGIYLSENIESGAILVGNAIEALAMKYTFLKEGDGYHKRGVMAFKRNDTNLSFNFLSNHINYVTNTYRQNTSRYLTSTYGLDLVSGNLYSKYKLKNSAVQLIDGLDKGSGKIKALRGWLLKKDSHLKNYTWLQFENIQQIEIDIYSEILRSELPNNSFFSNFGNLRKELYELSGDAEGKSLESQVSCSSYKNIIKTSKKFLRIKNLLDIAVNKAGQILAETNGSHKYQTLSKKDLNILKREIEKFNKTFDQSDLTTKQKAFIEDSALFFKSILDSSNEKTCLKLILSRAPDFFNCDEKYSKGIFFSDTIFKYAKELKEGNPYSVSNLFRIKEQLSGK